MNLIYRNLILFSTALRAARATLLDSNGFRNAFKYSRRVERTVQSQSTSTAKRALNCAVEFALNPTDNSRKSI